MPSPSYPAILIPHHRCTDLLTVSVPPHPSSGLKRGVGEELCVFCLSGRELILWATVGCHDASPGSQSCILKASLCLFYQMNFKGHHSMSPKTEYIIELLELLLSLCMPKLGWFSTFCYVKLPWAKMVTPRCVSRCVHNLERERELKRESRRERLNYFIVLLGGNSGIL